MRKMPKLTFEQIKALDKEMLTPMDVCGVLKCAPYNINVKVKQAPELLGFPVIMVGNRVKIPRRAFVNYIEGKQEEQGK